VAEGECCLMFCFLDFSIMCKFAKIKKFKMLVFLAIFFCYIFMPQRRCGCNSVCFLRAFFSFGFRLLWLVSWASSFSSFCASFWYFGGVILLEIFFGQCFLYLFPLILPFNLYIYIYILAFQKKKG
jgi:hypothetical protein